MSLFAHINFSKLPVPTVGEAFWKCTKIDEFLNLATNTPHTAWFQKIAVAPTKFSVNFETPPEARSRNYWEIQMEFKDHVPFVWRFHSHPELFGGAKMKLKIGEHQLISRLLPGDHGEYYPILHSYMTKYQTGFLEIVDWLRKFFKCEPTDIKIGTECIKNYDEILHWQPLLNTPKLIISESNQSQFITELLERRNEKQLRTHIDFAEIRNPRSVSIEALSSLDYISGRIDFTNLDSNFLTEYVRNFLGRKNSKFHVFRGAIPDWTRDQVNAFGTDLNLEPFDVDLNRTHKPVDNFNDLSNDSRMFQKRKNEWAVLVFHFFQNKEGFYKIAISVWSPKQPRPRH
ncbi:hypothetical protein B9Z55_017460 [Caenorhabditis nigoni]|uniref:DUF38 domain-containing protein n=1 Tax=Caenorhabditis nigoni TaxID=1611254 RepID=A0A2G5T9I7_9PELO|nr:hypothetical protein B9Z55_017460 [Caenorhabditis nigoni]